MSRSALWRQEANIKERERQASETFLKAFEEGKTLNVRGAITLIGGDTFNLNPMLLQNISKSQYFIKCCNNLLDWSSLVDEIYYEVQHMEPFLGTSKNPSTCFCLLVRLFTLRCTEKQMTSMLSHPDSPYIRCIGFLYLRYACEPHTLWRWIEPFINDNEKVFISASHKKEESIGQYVHDLLTEMDYHGTLLPRLPLNVEREIKVKLLLAEKIEDRAKQHLKNKGSNSAMEYFQIGARIRGLYGDDENPTTWYDGVIDNVIYRNVKTGEELSRPLFVVTFPEYGNTETVTLGELDYPEQRQFGSQHDHERRHRSDRIEESYGNRSKEYRPTSGNFHERNHGGYERKNVSNSYHSGNSRGYDMECHGNQRGRYMDDNESSRRSRKHRSRSREREFESQGAHSRPMPLSVKENNQEHALLEEVLRRERDKSAAKGKAYAVRPPTFKSSLASKDHVGSISSSLSDRDNRGRPREKKRSYADHLNSGEKGNVRNAAPPEMTSETKAAIERKKEKLLAKYG